MELQTRIAQKRTAILQSYLNTDTAVQNEKIF